MKKVIEGYIARDYNNIIFSNKPMKQSGFFGDGNIWYPTIEHEEHFPLDFRADIHEYMNIPELTEENSPRHCTITIEVGDFVGEKLAPLDGVASTVTMFVLKKYKVNGVTMEMKTDVDDDRLPVSA